VPSFYQERSVYMGILSADPLLRIKSRILGATLTSELICRQGRNPLEKTTAKKCHLRKSRSQTKGLQ